MPKPSPHFPPIDVLLICIDVFSFGHSYVSTPFHFFCLYMLSSFSCHVILDCSPVIFGHLSHLVFWLWETPTRGGTNNHLFIHPHCVCCVSRRLVIAHLFIANGSSACHSLFICCYLVHVILDLFIHPHCVFLADCSIHPFLVFPSCRAWTSPSVPA